MVSGQATPTPQLLTRVLRVDIANRLEKSLQQGREMLATYETQLAQEDTVPESGQALDSRRQELAVSVQTLGPGSPSLSWVWALRAPIHPRLWTIEGPKAQDSKSLQVWNPSRTRGLCSLRKSGAGILKSGISITTPTPCFSAGADLPTWAQGPAGQVS